jgi:ABC-type nitrate/sulfonate/bicarbonate transport system permease component
MTIVRRYGVLALGVVLTVLGVLAGTNPSFNSYGCAYVTYENTTPPPCVPPVAVVMWGVSELVLTVIGLILIGGRCGFALARSKHRRSAPNTPEVAS